MTKVEIKRFLLIKKEETKKKCWDDYAQKINEVFDEYAAANFTEVEKAFAKFQEEGNKAIAKTEKKWKLGYAYNLQAILNAESFSKLTVNCFYSSIESLYYKTRSEDLQKIEENYNSLIANVTACKNAKEAEEYVRSLGFELPITENNGCTTLAAPINTAYLFYGKEKLA